MANPNKKNVTSQAVQARKINPLDDSKVKLGGLRHKRISWQEKPTYSHIKMLPGRKYELKSTGEVFDMKPKLDKKTSHHLRKTFDNLRWLIRSNFTDGGQNQVLLTLTYPHCMRNTTQAYEDFNAFWKRLKRHLPEHKLEYITVLEPQGSGSWHLHVMIKSDQPELWIDKHTIKRIWGQKRRTDGEWTGAYIERLKSDDVGAYYVSYFTHLYEDAGGNAETFEKAMDIHETEKNIHDPDIEGRMELLKKSKIKGGRLKYYPKDTKFYRCSRGIERPKEFVCTYGELMEEIEKEGFHEVYNTAYELVDEDGKVLNTYQKAYYKKSK
jgi:hypothetical protein